MRIAAFLAVVVSLAGCVGFAQPPELADLLSEAQALTKKNTPESLNSAVAVYAQARQIAAAAGDNPKQLEALFGAAQAYFQLREIAKEFDPLLQAEALAHSVRDQQAEGRALLTLGACYRAVKKPQAALEVYDKAEALYEAAHDDAMTGRTLLASGHAHLELPEDTDRQKAIECFHKAIVLLQLGKDYFNLGLAWWALGSAEDRLEHRAEGRDAYSNALPLVMATNTPMAQGMVLSSLGGDERILEHYEPAISALERALPLLVNPQAKSERNLALTNLGMAQEGLGDTAAALETYRKAAVASETSGELSFAATAQLKISTLYGREHAWKQAIAADEEALRLHTKAGDLAGEATALSSLGHDCARSGDYRKALEYELKALPLLQGDANRFARAVTLYATGDAYNALHESAKALDYLQRALDIYDQDSEGQAGVLASMGEVYADMGDRRTALQKYEKALAIARAHGTEAAQDKILNDIALAEQWLTGKADAEKILRELLASAQRRHDPQQEAATSNNLGELARSFGDFGEAKAMYLRALALNVQLGERYNQAHNLSGLALSYSALGEEQKALDALHQALEITKQLDDPAGQGSVLDDLAQLYGNRGEYQLSLETYNQALNLIRGDDNPDLTATLLNGIASTYSELGAYGIAEDYYSRALEIHKRLLDDYGTGLVLNNLAVIFQRAGKRTQALRSYEEALGIAEKTGNKLVQSQLLSSESVLYGDMGNPQRALANLDRALQIAQKINDVSSQAMAIHNRAGIRADEGDLKAAIEDYDSALSLWKQINSTSGQTAAFSGKAKLERKTGDLEGALRDVRESVKLADNVRGQLGTADLRASMVAAWSNSSEVEVGVLMQLNTKHPGQGYDTQAFEASERGRARSLVEMLRTSHLEVHGNIDPALQLEARSIQSSLDAKASKQMKLAQTAEGKSEAQRLGREMQDLRVRYDNVSAAIQKKSPEYAALTKPEPIGLRDIQRTVLDRDSLLLEYSLGEERSYLWAVGRDSFHSYELPKRTEIEAAAREFESLVATHVQNLEALRQAGLALAGQLLRPEASELKDKRLVLVPDGELQRLAFAILPDPNGEWGEPLLAAHEIVSEPSASVLAVERSCLQHRKPAPQSLAVIADPVFRSSDERLGQTAVHEANAEPTVLVTAERSVGSASASIERLPFTGEEAKRILQQVHSRDALLLSGLRASKTQMERPELSQYRVIHFATHGLLDFEHPELSGLVLSLYGANGEPVDGFLRLNEIYNLKLPAELVVLSACESGRGKILRSEGVVGLTRGFLYAGAKTLAVSLWSVNDASTAELMARFYASMMGKPHQRPAAAMRAAQLSMRSDERWRDPYYWAAFTIQGEWR